MISTYTPLPLPTTDAGHAEAPPPGADAARDDNAPTFQARLDQQNDLYRAQRAPAPAGRAPVTPRPDDTDTSDAPDTEASNSAASGTADSADSVQRDDADNGSQTDKAEATARDRRKDDTTGSAASALPFTAATLALAGSLAPIPTPAVSVSAPAVSDHAANVNQAASTPVPTLAASMAANASGLASTVAPAGTNAASTPLHASASVSLNVSLNIPLNLSPDIPLNTPGVSMDSNAAGKIAASGVANASLPTPAQATAPTLALPLPIAADAATLAAASTVNAATRAAANAANTGETPPAAQTPATPASSAPLSANATNPGVLITAPTTGTAAPTAQATNTVQADVLTAAPLAPGDTLAAQRGSKAATAVISFPLPGASGAAAVTSLTLPSTIPSGVTIAADNAGGTNPSEIASKEQNLGGIERMLTLGAGKTNENGANANAALAASASETAGAAPANAALPGGENRAAVQTGGYAAHLPGPLPANPGTAAALPNANPGPADPTSAINPQTVSPGVTGTTNTLAAPLSSAARVAEILQSGVKNSLTGPAPLAAAEPTATSANTTAGLLATASASSRSTSQDAANEQAQSDAQGRSQENTGEDNPAVNLNGVASAPTANAQATAGTGATGATGTSAPNGSSQLDRAQVVAQVTQHLEGMRLANGNGEMRVRLTPGHLGNVQISVASHQDGVVARIAVETAQIQQVMDGAKAHLRATLEARGLHVQSVEITVTPHYNGSNGSGQSAFGQPRGSESMGERMAERAAYGRALPASKTASTDSAVSTARATPLTRTAASRLDCQA